MQMRTDLNMVIHLDDVTNDEQMEQFPVVGWDVVGAALVPMVLIYGMILHVVPEDLLGETLEIVNDASWRETCAATSFEISSMSDGSKERAFEHIRVLANRYEELVKRNG